MKRFMIVLLLALFTIPGSRVPVFAADHSLPLVTSTYANMISYIDARLDDIAVQFQGITPTNIPTNTVRFNPSTYKREKWNGSAWVDLAATYAENVHTVDGFHASQTPASNEIPVTGSDGRLTVPKRIQMINGTDGAITQKNAAGSYKLSMYRSALDTLVLGDVGDVIQTPTYDTFWHSGNDGAGSGLSADNVDGIDGSVIVTTSTGKATDSDKLDGKHWVTVLDSSTTLDTGQTSVATLRNGGSHKNYRISVYSNSASVPVYHGYMETSSAKAYTYIVQRPTGALDQFVISNFSGTNATFYYKIDVWE